MSKKNKVNTIDVIKEEAKCDVNNFSDLATDDRPLMQLFVNLVNGHGQNTVLTNSQLIDILHKELGVNMFELHVLEIDIYMNVMKKFLKEWPLWENFDSEVSKLKSSMDTERSRTFLNTRYYKLKSFLREVLKTAQPIAKEAVKKIRDESTPGSSNKETSDTNNDVVLEINCSRQQFNQLIYRRPNPKHNNSIFNVTKNAGPSRISYTIFDLKTILNMSFVSFSIKLNNFHYKREITLEYKHRLINKKLPGAIIPPKPIDLNVESKLDNAITFCPQIDMPKFLLNIQKYLIELFPQNMLISVIFDIILNDSNKLPTILNSGMLFRRNLNKYPYVRYLYSDIESQVGSDKYDLQIEEQVIPKIMTHVNKIVPKAHTARPNGVDWIQVDCLLCNVTFCTLDEKDIVGHFNQDHHEIDWQCSNCQEYFTLHQLCQSEWSHQC